MKAHRLPFLILALAFLGTGISSGAVILTPFDTHYQGSFTYIDNAFNNQPTGFDTAPIGGDNGNADVVPDQAVLIGRTSYIDLGEDWADWRIEQTWTRYIAWRSGDGGPYLNVWWGDSSSTTLENGIVENTLNFNTQPHGGPSQNHWIMDVDVSGSPITPQGRYLILEIGADTLGNDPVEYAFVGTIVPEPTTACLLALGLGVIAFRRRARR